MILGLLLGNTSLRYGVFGGDAIVLSDRIPWGELPARGAELAQVCAEYRPREAVAGSVRDDLLGRVEPLLPRDLLPLILARRDFPLPIENLYENPDEAGTDRLLNCIAARERARGAGAVVVDFGTAVSISVVSPAGEFIGGLIGAGIQAVKAGLESAAPCLPRVEVNASPELSIGRTTVSAIRAGLYLEVTGGVRAMVRAVLSSLSFRPIVIATGGGADPFLAEISEIEARVPDLTLEGLRLSCCSRPGGSGTG